MKTMKKIVAILAVALLLCSVLPLSVMAADTTVVFELGANGSASHNDGSSASTYSATVDGYKLTITGGTNMYTGARDAKGNSCLKLGTSSKAGSFTISNIPSDVTSVVIAVAAYKAKTATMNINGTTTTLTKKSDNGQYDVITVDTTSTKSISVAVSSGYRAMVNSITFVIADTGSAECDHKWVDATCTAAKKCSECGATEGEALGHDWEIISEEEATCTADGSTTYECAACGEDKVETIPALPHNYVDGFCSVCDAEMPLKATITFNNPAKRTSSTSTKQVWEENGIVVTYDKNTYNNNLAEYDSPIRFYAGTKITISYPGIIKVEIVANNSSYASVLNNSISGSTLNGTTVTYIVDTTDSVSFVPTAQTRVDSITVYAAAQSGGDDSECEADHDSLGCEEACPECDEIFKHHKFSNTCIEKCENDCGTANPDYVAGHKYSSVVDKDCDICSATREVTIPTDPTEIVELLYTLPADASFPEAVTLSGVIVEITEAYTDQYKNITAIIHVIDANGDLIEDKPVTCFRIKGDGADVIAVGDTITVKGILMNYKGSTYEFATGSSLESYEKPEPACEHEYEYDCSKNCKLCGEETRPEAAHQYFYACDPVCMICYELTNPEAAHTMTFVPAKDATCTENGNIAYWTCGACGGCWDNENATGMPLNRMMVVVPAAHTYFDDCSAICEVCGEEREVSHNVIHVEAIPATCTTEGNIEYWYCDVCGAAWLDAECTLNTNLMSVKQPASCSYGAQYFEAKAATCYEPGNTEYWYCANCDVYYADAACAIVTNAKNVIIPITHNIIHVDAKAATCTTAGNIEYWYCDVCGQAWLDELCHLNTNLKSVVLPASCSYGAVYTAAKAATCFEPGNVEYWYCANCDVYYADAACAIITNAKNVIIPITHNVIHVEAKAATCTELGNIEYWYCADCGSAWLDDLCHLNTNLKAVVLGATCSTNAVYTEAKAATCFEPGNVEYWYCANCDVYYLDAACTIITNAKSVVLPIAHNVIHVEAKAATCTELGNIEYWYCADCGAAWLDELCHLNTNLKAVVLPMADHTYDNNYDADCNVCGAEREVAAFPIIESGKSASEDCTGYAVLFDANVEGLELVNGAADYTNATYNGYKLLELGVVATNGKSETTIKGDRVYGINDETGVLQFAFRIINIPADKLDAKITMTPYYIVEIDGVATTLSGDAIVGSYAEVAAD